MDWSMLWKDLLAGFLIAGALSAFEALLADRGHAIAALIIEPLLQGAGGMRLCRPSFLKRLVKTAREAGILIIFDEEDFDGLVVHLTLPILSGGKSTISIQYFPRT